MPDATILLASANLNYDVILCLKFDHFLVHSTCLLDMNIKKAKSKKKKKKNIVICISLAHKTNSLKKYKIPYKEPITNAVTKEKHEKKKKVHEPLHLLLRMPLIMTEKESY